MSTTLEDISRTLREIASPEFTAEVAREAAKDLHESVIRTLSAAETPEGVAWAPKKRGDGRPYAGVAGKLDTKTYGDVIRLRIPAPDAYGNYGSDRMQRRQMLPDAGAGLPESVTKALTSGARRAFLRVTK